MQILSDQSTANLPAHCVFLLVKGALVGTGNVASVMACHGAFFGADLVIFSVQRGCLAAGHFTFFDLLVDTSILVGKTPVDLLATRVILLPLGIVCHCATSHACRQNGDCHTSDQFSSKHRELPSLLMPGRIGRA